MKTIIFNLLIAVSFSAFSQLNTADVSNSKPLLFPKGYNGANGSFAWGCIGTTALMVGGGLQYLSTQEQIPSFEAYDNEKLYNAALNKYENKQRNYHYAFGVGVGVAGISYILAVNDLIYYKREYKTSKHTSVSFKANPAQASLCLNFK